MQPKICTTKKRSEILNVWNESNVLTIISRMWKGVTFSSHVMTFFRDYVLHSINAFHLMKRAVQLWPKLNDPTLSTPDKKDFIFGASYGILSLQVYHDLSLFHLAKGIIEDPVTLRQWKSCKSLSSEGTWPRSSLEIVNKQLIFH